MGSDSRWLDILAAPTLEAAVDEALDHLRGTCALRAFDLRHGARSLRHWSDEGDGREGTRATFVADGELRLEVATDGPLAPDCARGLQALAVRGAKETELSEARQLQHLYDRVVGEGLMVHEEGEIVAANPRIAELLGYDGPTDLIGRHVLTLTTPSDRERAWAQEVDAAEEPALLEARRKDGSTFLSLCRPREATYRGRRVRAVAVRDVTEDELQKQRLEASEASLRALAKVAFDGFLVLQRGMIVEASEGFLRTFERRREELVGKAALTLTVGELRKEARRSIDGGEERVYEVDFEDHKGRRRSARIYSVPFGPEEEELRISGFVDLTEERRAAKERERLEAQLQDAQRMESIGVLAGGIAHDFNNLLTGILGNAELLSEGAEGEVQEAAEDVLLGARRAAELVQLMLAYAGRAPLRLERVDLSSVVGELRALLKASLSKKAHLRVDLPGDPLPIRGDPVRLRQVLMNLLTNASDALEGARGTISIRARVLPALPRADRLALGDQDRPGPFVLLEVEDDGVGMALDTRRRIFEPFFSTKGPGRGLGLAACQGIVRSHGGALRVESQRGAGTCFRLLLPVAASEGEGRASSAPPGETAPRVTTPQRVLVVDDEAAVRRTIRRVLERRSFRVVEAADGVEALAAVEEGEPFDAAVLDLSMPNMDGAELAAALRERGHDVPILICSGYSDFDAQGAALRALPGVILLQKPFVVEDLLRSVRTLCGTGARSER